MIRRLSNLGILAVMGLLLSTASAIAAGQVVILGTGRHPASPEFNFGAVPSGQRPSETFRIVNRTGGAVVLNVIPDCGCVQIKVAKEGLRNGQSTTARVWFNTAARNGAVGEAATGFVIRNASTQRVLATAAVLAKLRPTVCLSRNELHWSLEPGVKPGKRLIEVRNSLSTPVDVSWRGPRRRSERPFEITPDFLHIRARREGRNVIQVDRSHNECTLFESVC
jgi:hypothetical protein